MRVCDVIVTMVFLGEQVAATPYFGGIGGMARELL